MEESNDILAEKLVNKLKICLKIVRIMVFAMIACVAALVIFVTAASLTGLRTGDPAAFMLGVIITGGLALLCAIAPLVTFIAAKVYISKLKKLGPLAPGDAAKESNSAAEENNSQADGDGQQ